MDKLQQETLDLLDVVLEKIKKLEARIVALESKVTELKK